VDLIEIGLSLIVGFAGGYAIRAAVSATRRRKVYRLRRADALRAAEAERRLALTTSSPKQADNVDIFIPVFLPRTGLDQPISLIP